MTTDPLDLSKLAAYYDDLFRDNADTGFTGTCALSRFLGHVRLRGAELHWPLRGYEDLRARFEQAHRIFEPKQKAVRDQVVVCGVQIIPSSRVPDDEVWVVKEDDVQCFRITHDGVERVEA